MSTSRRSFIRSAATLSGAAPWAAAASQAVRPAAKLPTVRFRDHDLTRLVIGSNPFYGYSHFNSLLDRFMRDYYTPERRIEVLKRAEQAGINTWQVHYNDPTIEDFRRYRAEGGKMNVLLLADFELMKNWKLLPAVAKLGFIGIGHHGNRTDERFRNGQMSVVRDFVNAVHDAGAPAGVSMHNPAVLEYIEERGWPVDYYMTCMYRVSRTAEETRKEFGEAPLGEAFMEKDPSRMCAAVRQTKKTCFAFKVFGAGRNSNRPEQMESAMRFVLANIKPQDPVIVGMCPRFKDEISENVELVGRLAADLRS
ncbi:MAG TPA: hypothetical protein VFL57_03560 [Bryobacteraceae bacterium]|nr:hypothetical protein [Bryobacteraceae bacterium]